MEVVKVINLSKSIGIKNILNNVTLILHRGERLNIYGREGSGKTILIKCLLDLVIRDGGSISIFGYDPLNYREEILKQVGYIPQNVYIRTRLNLGDILDVIHNLYEERYGLLEELGLIGYIDEDVRKLNYEHLIRLYTYIALAKEPKLIIIDDIETKIDGKSLYLIRRYIDRNNITLITTSRNPSNVLGEYIHALLDGGGAPSISRVINRMYELLTLITMAIAKDYKIISIFTMVTLLAILKIFGLIIYPHETLMIINIVLLILLITTLTYRLRSIKNGLKEIYYSLPYRRESMYISEVLISVISISVFNTILVFTHDSGIDLNIYIYTVLLPSIFLGVTIVNISDDKKKNTIQWLLAIFLIPFTLELSLYILAWDVYSNVYWIFNLLPHEIYLSLNQVKTFISFLNIGYNIFIYIIYLFASFYIGLYIRMEKDVL